MYTTTFKFLSHKVETSVFDGFGDSQHQTSNLLCFVDRFVPNHPQIT